MEMSFSGSMTVLESYILDTYIQGKGPDPVSQEDFPGKTLVQTPYGYGIIDSTTAICFKILLLNGDMRSINPNASVSLPWDRVRVLPDTTKPTEGFSGVKEDMKVNRAAESPSRRTKRRTDV
jgi:hypothetical protein